MSTSALYMIYAGAFVSVLLFIEACFFFYQDHFTNRANVNRRMKMINKAGDGRAALSLIRNKEEKGFIGAISSLWPSLDQLIWTAGSTLSKRNVIILSLILAALVVFVFRIILSFPLPVSTVIGVASGVLVPWLALRTMAARRQTALTRQLPNAIDLMVRGLEAGHPVSVAMGLVSKEMSDPIGTEFGIAIDEMTYGLSMDSALENMVERFPNPDLKFLAISVQIQRETGGNLVDILTALSRTLRERMSMYRKIRAITAEGRLSAMVVAALPFVIGMAVLVVRPQYYEDVSQDPLFTPALVIAGILLVLGTGVIWRMVNLKV